MVQTSATPSHATTASGSESPELASEAHDVERRALQLGIWTSLLIAVSGVLAFALSASDALLLDGLYAAVMALTSLVAARIGRVVQRPPEPGWPYGFGGQEALFVLFRSLLLIGMLSAALLTALREIGSWLSGGAPPEAVELGPVAAYTLLTVGLCLLLAWRQHRAWLQCGRRSALLLLESRAAALDAAITAAAGGALLAGPLLSGTPLEPLVPLTDPLLVVLIALVVMVEPVRHFLEALRQTAGAACSPELIASCRARVLGVLEELTGAAPVALLGLSLQRLGRITFLVIWFDPSQPVDGGWMDALRSRIAGSCQDLVGPLQVELVLTCHPPFTATGEPADSVQGRRDEAVQPPIGQAGEVAFTHSGGSDP